MSGLNEVKLIGNLGADPEIKTFENGNQVANFTVATSETWKDKTSGEKKEKVEWHRVTVYGSLVKVIEKYVCKGTKVFLSGKLETRKWQNKEGQDQYTTEVVLQNFGSNMLILAKWKEDAGQAAAATPAPAQAAQDLDDDIPF